jgi:ribosomally synthesized peptide
MSQRAVEQALGKLVTDEGFREAFFTDPPGTARRTGLDLTPKELDALRRVPRHALDVLGAGVDDRICRLHVPGVSPREEGRR